MAATYEGAVAVHRGGAAGSTSYLPAVRARPEVRPEDASKVQRWRAMGASWQAIANNLGCSLDAARKCFDPHYLPMHLPAEPLVAAKGSAEAGRVARNTYQFDVIAALDAQWLDRAALGEKVPVRRADLWRVIGVLIEKGLVSETRKGVLALTFAGRAELDRHLSIDPSRDHRSGTRRGTGCGWDSRSAREQRVMAALLEGSATSDELTERLATPYEAVRLILRLLKADGDLAMRRVGPRQVQWGLTLQGRAKAEAAPRG